MVAPAGAAQLALTLTASAGIAAGLAYTAYTQQPSGTILSTWKACNWPAGSSPGNSYAVIDSTLCVALPILREARADLLSIGLFSLALSGILPLYAHLAYTAISPNARLSFLSAATPLFIAASHFIGAGILAAGPLVLLYAVGALFFLGKGAQLAPLPTSAIGVYALNFLLWTYSAAAFGIMYLDPTGSKWYKCFLALLLVPAALVNLPTITAGFKVPRNEADVRTDLRTYSAGEVSAAFERTWASYRRIGFISAIFYWYGLGRVANAFIYEFSSVHLTDASLNALLTFAGTTTALYALIALERLTFRPRTSTITTSRIDAVPANTKTTVSKVNAQTPLPHPLTGAQPSKLALECEAAIARAPAGYPIVEIGVTGTALASLLGGPGLAAAFWWARGEEEAGWRSRREWREVQALATKKQ